MSNCEVKTQVIEELKQLRFELMERWERLFEVYETLTDHDERLENIAYRTECTTMLTLLNQRIYKLLGE